MLIVFWKVIRDRRYSLLAYTVSAILFLWIYVGMFPGIKSQSENFMKLMESYPESLMKAFNIESIDFTHLENFVAMEQFSFVWPIMAVFLLISLGGSAIADEIERGTIEILLSQPISRIKIFFGKYFAGVFTLVVFTFLSIFAVVPLAATYNIDYRLENFATGAVLCFIFGLAILSLSFLFSAIFSDKGKVYFMSGGILVLMYVLNIISSLKENLADLKYFSFFYYFNTFRALNHAEIDKWAYIVFLGITVVTTILALWIFKKRDVAV